ncbi:DUF2889 domain-containing protein [Pseudonocardia sp. KRD-291]|nr:DUF2889 domain-containing protein [Pseudonocardia sp. KRD291]
MSRQGHPGHGPREPVTRGAPAVPGSIRRTIVTDAEGGRSPGGVLALRGSARDLHVGPAGGATVVDTATTDLVIDRSAGAPVVAELVTMPARPGAGVLVGGPAQSGFRAALAAALPEEQATGSLLYRLLDDVPGMMIISGYARAVEPPVDVAAGGGRTPPANVCSGWRSDGTMMVAIRRDGGLPPMSGPAAPDLAADGPGAWHPHRTQQPGEVRRVRRTDVVTAGAVVRVEAMFRDTYRDTAGAESVVHEYRLEVQVDRADRRIRTVRAEPRVLPWTECPIAAASAERLVGLEIDLVPRVVRAGFAGTSTCTHLNDALRALADVPALLAHLERPAAPGL